jgi:radical SAM protein with 4Fe4S-binding SPASM domain
MIVNKYIDSNRKITHRIKVKLQKMLPQKKAPQGPTYGELFYEKYPSADSVKLFETVQIETFNRCNGVCSFCPANKNVDTRKPVKMSDELFEKITDELGEMEYSGRIAMFSNNEPLLDEKLEERAKIAKTKCPKAHVYIYTNGTLMTVERLKKMEPWLDEIIIDNYNDELEINENLKPIVKMCEADSKLDKKVIIHLRKINEVLYTRGGQSPNNDKREVRDYPCYLPFNQLVIRPDGKVSLCCSDALGVMTLGDVSRDTLETVWYSPEYQEIRKKVFADIAGIDLCRYCDSKHRN